MIFKNININALILTGGATVGCYYLYKKIIGSDPIVDYKNMVLSISDDILSMQYSKMPIKKYAQQGIILSGLATTIYGLSSFKCCRFNDHGFELYMFGDSMFGDSIYVDNNYRTSQSIKNIILLSSLYSPIFMTFGTFLYLFLRCHYPIFKVPLISLIPMAFYMTNLLLYNLIYTHMYYKSDLSSPVIGIIIGLLISEMHNQIAN